MRILVIILFFISSQAHAEITGNFQLGEDCKSIHLALGGNEHLYKKWRGDRYRRADLKYPGEYYNYSAVYDLLCSRDIVSVVTIDIDASSETEHNAITQFLRKKLEDKYKSTGVDLTESFSADLKKPTYTTLWENEEVRVFFLHSKYMDSSKVRVSIEKKNE